MLATPNDVEGVRKSGVNRAINRHRWDYPTLRGHLEDETSVHARSLTEINRRCRIRRAQPAFHPNATQFTIQLGEKLFGFWRQSLHRDQSIFAVHNMTAETVSLPSRSLNLIDGEDWVDLLSDEVIEPLNNEISFAPYQCRWITNLRKAPDET